MSYIFCSDDEVRKILEKELSDIDTLIEIIKVKAGDYGSLFVYIPQTKNTNKHAKMIIEIRTWDKKVYFTILLDKESSFMNIAERTYYDGTHYRIMHFYNILLSANSIKGFINQFFSSSFLRFTLKSLITMQLGANGTKVIHESSLLLK